MPKNKSESTIASEPTILDHVNDESERKQAMHDLRSLKKHNGWIRVARWLLEKGTYHQKQLNGDSDVEQIKSMEDLRFVRFKRNMSEQLSNLPDLLAAFIEMEGEDPELDPFYTPDELSDTLEGNKK